MLEICAVLYNCITAECQQTQLLFQSYLVMYQVPSQGRIQSSFTYWLHVAYSTNTAPLPYYPFRMKKGEREDDKGDEHKCDEGLP